MSTTCPGLSPSVRPHCSTQHLRRTHEHRGVLCKKALRINPDPKHGPISLWSPAKPMTLSHGRSTLHPVASLKNASQAPTCRHAGLWPASTPTDAQASDPPLSPRVEESLRHLWTLTGCALPTEVPTCSRALAGWFRLGDRPRRPLGRCVANETGLPAFSLDNLQKPSYSSCRLPGGRER